MDGLSDDILLEIFDWVGRNLSAVTNRRLTYPVQFDNDALYRNLLNITLACKSWHGLAQAIIDHTLNLVIARAFEARNLKLVCRLWYDHRFRCRVKRIHIREWHHDRLETFAETRPNGGTGYYYSASYRPPSQSWQTTSKQISALAKSLERLTLVSFT